MRGLGLLSSIWLAGCSVVGIQDAAEPEHRLVSRGNGFEVRHYPAQVVAWTVIDNTGPLDAREAGFRRLAGYIFGGNANRRSIPMTAPVSQAARTSEPDAGPTGWRICFFMPAGSRLESLPAPRDPSVHLEAVPARTVAVRGFRGRPTPGAVQRQTQTLLQALDTSPWRVAGAPEGWFYDPPWTLPPLRRNEVAVPVDADGSPRAGR